MVVVNFILQKKASFFNEFHYLKDFHLHKLFYTLLLTKIGDKYKETIMQGIALTVTLIGLQMALETNAVIIVLVSIVFGALLGELLKLEAILNWFGEWVTSKFKNKDNSFNIG